MDFVRQIVNSNTLASILDLPPSFQDVQVEVIVLPVNDKKNSLNTHDFSIKSVKHTAFGRLKAYSNPSLIPDEKGAWERAVAEKYVLH
jgi:molybdopterin biosynthesis enzyme MoaB